MYSKTFPRNTSSFFIFLKKAPPPQYTHAAATVRALRAFENASGLAVGCPQSVESAVLWAFEDSPRTRGGCFWHRVPLKIRRVPQEPVLSTEYLFRTVEACFAHRMLLKTRRVPEEAFLSTARIFGTLGGPLRYRVPSKGQGKGSPELPIDFFAIFA